MAHEPSKPDAGRNPAATSRAETFFGSQSQQLDDWLKIAPDGTIMAFSGKVELGTGTRTALSQIVAEELDVPFERVRLVMGDTALTPDEGYTAGSRTVMRSGSALRQAAAEARRVLLEMASEQLDAVPAELVLKDGVISVKHDPARTITYAELMGGKSFQREVSGNAPLKRPEDYHIVGTSVPRVDIPAKVTAQPSFIHDVRLPGMLHGRIVYPPSPGAKLIALDEQSVAGLPGLVKVVRLGSFVGVLAEHEEQAIRVAEQLKVEWQETASLPAMDDLYAALRAQPTQDNVLVEKGSVETTLKNAARQVHATYYQPFHAHASIGPACAVADVKPDQATIWASVQGPNPLRGALAQLLNMPVENLRLIHMEGAGCYGQNGADDVAADAAVLSQAVGKPVRVQWSRQQEFLWEPKAPAMMVEVQGGLDNQGHVVAWEYHAYTPTHAGRPRFGAQLLAGQWMSDQPPGPTRFFLGGERNAPTNYAFPNQRVAIHWLANSLLRVSSFRSLGGAGNTFANESFMDELAAAAGIDALEFRFHHLTDPRAQAVLTAVANKANWQAHPARQDKREGTLEGRGIAFAQYENEVAYVATIAEVQVDTVTGVVHVKRIVVAHDCGLIINPDGLRNQIEGNVIQSLSRALKEEVKFDEQRITSLDWETYPILTFSEVPDVEIVLINHLDKEPFGAGEPATVTTAAAVANAIFDATGVRIRRVPFTPARLKAAFQQTTAQD
jgi:nicotinate dehydrogenase subunit B